MSEPLEGLADVLRDLNKEIEQISGRTLAGMWDAGLQVQRVAQQELRPSVITGNLRASAYTRRTGDLQRLDPSKMDQRKVAPDPTDSFDGVEIGFTAVYAAARHEDMEGRAPKFLERPLQRNRQQILEIIRKRAVIKP